MTHSSPSDGLDIEGFSAGSSEVDATRRRRADTARLRASAPRVPAHAEPRTQVLKEAPVLRWLVDTVVVLVGAVVIALLLRMFVVQVYQIPSKSMTDTLQVGSRITVSRIPVLGSQVERGDVVVFQDDLDWLPTLTDSDRGLPVRIGEFLGILPADGEQVLVKRVIGVGGDTVECCSPTGNLIVNGVEIDEPYIAEGSTGTMPFEVTVPEGYLWVMGDNRANSADSLYHYMEDGTGFVPESAVIGRAFWKIWPISDWSYLGNRDVFEDVK